MEIDYTILPCPPASNYLSNCRTVLENTGTVQLHVIPPPLIPLCRRLIPVGVSVAAVAVLVANPCPLAEPLVIEPLRVLLRL